MKRIFLILGLLLLVPSSAQAVLLRVSPGEGTYTVGQSGTATVMLDPEGQPLNAVSLQIDVPQVLRITGIDLGGSAVQFWVHPPSYTKQTVTLEGGSPGQFENRASVIAKIKFEATAVGSGTIAIRPSSAVLLADGQGTAAQTQAIAMGITVRARAAGTTPHPDISEPPISQAANDDTAPKRFSLEIGQDGNIFSGQYFVSFFTTDRGTGIARYEVSQNGGAFVLARSPYLLSDQSLHSVIRVRAFDDAGNVRESVYPGILKRIWWWLTGIFWKE